MFWSKKDKAAPAPGAAAAPPVTAPASAPPDRASAAPPPPANPAAMPPVMAAAPPAREPARPAPPPSANGTAPRGEAPKQIPGISAQYAPALGRIMSVILVSQHHARLPVGEIARRVLPPLVANQFVIAEAKPEGQDKSAPVGVAFWARLSDEVEQRLAADPRQPTRLAPGEWNSGPNPWLVEAIGPPRIIEAMLRQMLDGPFAGQPFKLRRRVGDAFVVETVDPSRIPPRA